MDAFAEAIQLAVTAHDGQYRKYSGEPYVCHPIRVAFSVEYRLRVAAVLHDVIEDTHHYLLSDGVYLDGVRVMALSEDDVRRLDAVTRRHEQGETYVQFINRIIASGPDAIALKCADIQDNMAGLFDLPEGDPERGLVKRYEKALEALMSAP